MVDLHDEVELTKNRTGIIRYKGPLYGKNGMFYGIELIQGTGKHGGLFRGKRYFTCHHTKGIFVDKKQILFKFAPSNNNTKQKRKKSKKTLARTTSQDLGKGRFKLPRKTGPSHAQASSNKSDWKPPEFMQDVLNDLEYDSEFLGERFSHRGKFQPKTKYEKAGYLPHAKWRKPIYKAEDWTAFLDGIKDTTLRMEMQKQMIEWKEELNEKQNYLSDDAMEEMTNKRILLEEEMKEMQYEKDKLADEYEQKLEQQRSRLQSERLFLKKEKERKQLEQEEIRKQMEEEKLRITKLGVKRQELESVRRELEEEEKRLKLARENSTKELEEEKQKLKEEREQMEYELNEQRKLMEEQMEEQRKQILNDEKKKLEKQHKLLQMQLKKQMEKQRKNEEKERKEWENRRIKIEQMKIKERKEREKRLKEIDSDEDRKREESPMFKGGYSSSDHSNYSPVSKKNKSKKRRKKRRRKRRKRKEPKAAKKDYKIYFSVNIETDEYDEDLISNTDALRYLLSELFDTRSEKDVFEIKTRKKTNGFKIDFGIIIATSMHPADYIDTFDDLTSDGSFQETIKEGFDLNSDPHVHIWEARYEKVDPKKQRRRKQYY